MRCALLVITIHTNPFERINITINFLLVNIISTIAVPFFSITTGYFFYEKYSRDKDYEIKYIKRMFKTYLTWVSIYSIFNIYFIKKEQEINFISLVKYIRDVFIRDSINYLWYFMATIYSITFIIYFIRRNKIKEILIISIVLYLLGSFGMGYYKIIDGSIIGKIIYYYNAIFGSLRNGICFGVPFLTIGIIINKYKLNKKIQISLRKIIILFVIYAIENSFLRYFKIASEYDITISLIILVFACIIFMLNNNIKLPIELSIKLRSISLGIYCSHSLFQILWTKIFILFNLDKYIISNLISFILISVSSIIFTYIAMESDVTIIKDLVR